MVLPISVMSLLLVWRHEANIRKLLAGTESRLGQKAAGAVKPEDAHHGRKHPHQGAGHPGHGATHDGHGKGRGKH